METFFIKLIIAVIPLILVVASVIAVSSLSRWYAHHPIAWHRRRRHLFRALAHGTMLR
jgi:hypothetical protein